MHRLITKDMFLLKPEMLKREAQVQIGPQEFPPPSEEEVQNLIDDIEDAANTVDKVVGYNATLTARYGGEFVEYMRQLSEGLHYLLLQGRRPGPPPGFEVGQPGVGITPKEPGASGPGGPAGPSKPPFPITGPGLGGPGALEGPAGRPALGPAPRPLGRPAARRQAAGQALAGLVDAVEDLDTRIGDSMDELTSQMRQAGRDVEALYALSDAADAARESINRIASLLEGHQD